MQRVLRVLSYNIHKGFSAGNQSFVLEKIRQALRALSPDFLFLQEVLGEHRGHQKRYRDWPTLSQFEFLAEEIWPHFAYGRNAVYSEGHHGNAILSKYPILGWENEDISTNFMERRGLLHAIVRPFDDCGELNLMCTHFGLLERDRQVQAQKVCQRIKRTVALGQRLVLAGDFNDWALRLTKILRHEVGLEEAHHLKHRRHARTFPSRIPVLRLDRIYFHGLEVRHAESMKAEPWQALSDHSPVLAEFDWP